jgi:hypothetical protein
MRRLLLGLAGLVVGLALTLLALVWGVGWGGLGALGGAGEITGGPLPREVRESARVRQLSVAPPGAPQILFGDLHVHTTFSNDAFLFSLPIIQGEGAHPPADACDFARFCSNLDFWSINDHAELITPRQWTETVESIRQCNAAAGDPEDPDLVSFLGWEWTNMSSDPERHYGHKNVVLLGTGDSEVPARPISAGRTPLDEILRRLPLSVRLLMALPDFPMVGPYADFNRYIREFQATPVCEEGLDVHALPDDCLEGAATPDVLFEKLSQWGFESLVIPHGTSWGIHAPANATLAIQLGRGMHDPERQRAFEIHSGHGSSELYRSWRHAGRDGDGEPSCPEPTDGFTPCCWRAGELVRERCQDASDADCESRVGRARRLFLEAGEDPRRFHLVPGARAEEWSDCGQLTDGFLPAYIYRPMMSAQYALALGDFEESDEPRRFRFGLIASSDNHKARAGSGYKEFARKAMGDAWGFRADVLESTATETEAAAGPISLEEVPPARMLLPERGASFYYTGGLVAVHAEGRSREAIWRALGSRKVYGTSGDRILLWFDLQGGRAGPLPMGSQATISGVPRFRVRAVGAFEQLPGCPDHVTEGLSPERLQRLCLGECYHPGDWRKLISRIEVIRIRPQTRPDEAVAELIEDPWRSFPCEPDPAGCAVEFEDPEFGTAGRETLYYVRAIQEPRPAVNGDPLRCERDAEGSCLRMRPCFASGPSFDPDDDCLAPVEERAWSSPIFLTPRIPQGDPGGGSLGTGSTGIR